MKCKYPEVTNFMTNIFDTNNKVNERLKDKVKLAFETLKRSGRPDIEIDRKNITSKLYIDLKENDLILKEAKNHLMHTFFIGRKGTGKSTIFLKALEELREEFLGLYINLQTCYEYAIEEEEIDRSINEKIKRIILRTNFLLNFLEQFRERLKERGNYFERRKIDKELENISKTIENGRDININETTKVWHQKIKEIGKEKGIDLELKLSPSAKLDAIYKKYGKDIETKVFETIVQKYFSITDIINSIYKISQDKISRIIIYLDDYSELNSEIQLLVTNFIIAPIIATFSHFVVFKIAAYPGRIAYGPNIDQTKINKEYLDYFEIYKNLKNYREMKKFSKDYIKRILNKRLEVITNKVQLSDIFDTDKSIDEYIDVLSNATINNPRALGYILSYVYEKTININKKISESVLNSAIKLYCQNHILADYKNDKRYMSSFLDKSNLIDLYTQQELSETIINKSKNMKKQIIKKYNDRTELISIPASILREVKNHRKGINYFIPTSHFHVNTGFERYLETLELYFILSKINELSSKDGRQQISIYTINYGICLLNNIDYGKYIKLPKYWQERIWNYQDLIGSTINSMVEIKCIECGEIFNSDELEMIKKYNYSCYKCEARTSVKITQKFPSSLMSEAAKRKKFILPNHYIEILRCLYNNKIAMTSKEISYEVDKSTASVAGALRSLTSKKLVNKVPKNRKNYWKIKYNTIRIYFEE